MQNFQGIVILKTKTYKRIFKSASVYLWQLELKIAFCKKGFITDI